MLIRAPAIRCTYYFYLKMSKCLVLKSVMVSDFSSVALVEAERKKKIQASKKDGWYLEVNRDVFLANPLVYRLERGVGVRYRGNPRAVVCVRIRADAGDSSVSATRVSFPITVSFSLPVGAGWSSHLLRGRDRER